MDTSKIEGEDFDHCALSSFSVDVVQLVRGATVEIVKKLDRNLEVFGLQLDMTGQVAGRWVDSRSHLSESSRNAISLGGVR